MGHIRLGRLPQTKKWREVVGLLETDAPLERIARAAADASERDLARASNDPRFQFVASLLVNLPFKARSPDYLAWMDSLGLNPTQLGSITGLLVGLGKAVDNNTQVLGRSSDAGDLAKAAFLESLSVQLQDRFPMLLEQTPGEIRKTLASFSGGQSFAVLARDFFARLTYRSLDYYLSRELANHTGEEQRFATDADRVAFQQALARHTFEASRIVQEYAGGWYGKIVWKEQRLDQEAINGFTRYAFKKMRSELGRRRTAA